MNFSCVFILNRCVCFPCYLISIGTNSIVHSLTVKGVIFAGFYFRYIHDLLMEREFNTPQIIVNYIIHAVNVNARYK